MRGIRPLVAALLLAPGGACVTSIEPPQLDRLMRNAGVLAVVVEPRFSLYLPYGGEDVGTWTTLLERELEQVFALFELEPGEPVVVWVESIGGSARKEIVPGEPIPIERPTDDVFGGASGNYVLIKSGTLFVEPQSGLTIHTGPSDEEKLRHELTHTASFRIVGEDAPHWILEGVAHQVQAYEHGAAGLTPPVERPNLVAAAGLPRSARDLEALLAWDQVRTEGETEAIARLLSEALTVYLIEVEQAGVPFPDAVRALVAMSDADVLARAPDWNAWLDGLVPVTVR